MSDSDATTTEGGAERRSFFRVRTRIPVRHRLLTEGEAQAFLSELASKRADRFVPMDPVIAARLDRLEQKLDLVLAALRREVERPLGPEDQQTITLSGSGLELETSDSLSIGEELLVEMRVPGSPARIVRALGRVVIESARSNAGKGRVALAFDAIDEHDREAIVRHVFDVERMERARRAASGEPS